MPLKKLKLLIIILFSALCWPLPSKSFSILAHEAIIDAEWLRVLRPLLKQKYPDATEKDLILAHSYAYGGSLVADIGYIPGGNAQFTDLLHYVRSGDFITNLIDEAQNLNDYAFALGSLSHYMADKYGHAMATNLTVPLLYPELKKKFGNVITYEDDHTSHSRMEFAYDALQVGRNRYASVAYHDFIGFNIAVPPLERAFLKTYGLALSTYFSNFNSSIAKLRWGVKNLFPALTKNAFKANKTAIKKENATANIHTFRYKMSKRMYKKEFGDTIYKPDFKARAVAFLIKILPKVGPLKKLKFVYPGAEGEKIFARVFDTIVVKYGVALNQVAHNNYAFADINFDTGSATAFGQYKLADDTYYELVCTLPKKGLQCMMPDLKQHILGYYKNADVHSYFKEKPQKQAEFDASLQQIRQYAATVGNSTATAAIK